MSKHSKFVLLLILAVSIFFRIYKLGYSDFQGDEVSAQNFLFGEQPFKDFLLTRSIPPGQYIVSFIQNNIFQSINPHLRVRLPFSLAGIIILIFIFLLQKEKSVIPILLIGVSGLFIAFSRIVQYQSFIMLFGVINVFCINKYTSTKNYNYIYLASITSAMAVLFHYDSLSYIIPSLIFLAVNKDFKGLLRYILPIGIIASFFYIPFVLKPEFRQTLNYLTKERIGTGSTAGALNYSLKILALYHSKEFLVITGLLLAFLFAKNFKEEKIPAKIVLTISLIFIISRLATTKESGPIIVVSVMTFGLLLLLKIKNIYLKKETNTETLVELWFYFSFLTYGLAFKMPLTHIYNFLLPLFLLIGYKIKQTKTIRALLGVAFISSISFNYSAFIETSREFPWEEKRYIFGNMPSAISSGEKLKGIFGFPYYRNWEEIRDKSLQLKDSGLEEYYSNEKYRLAKYYMQGFKWNPEQQDFYIYIKNPQSLSGELPPQNLRIVYEGEKYLIYENREY